MSRDYKGETRDTAGSKYTYNFDIEVMHPFMIRSFTPWFREGNCLELGSYRGAFTQRLLPYFDEIQCVEASAGAITKAQLAFEDKAINIRRGTFRSVKLFDTYNNVIMTHVLEHVGKPVEVLKRVNREWMEPTSRLFITCPNANAASRQIAVKAGIIPINRAITNWELKHGHQRTYTFDTLELDVRAAGLNIIHRSGIFFKGLANFQIDAAMAAGIISPEYLEGCYSLGQLYPDLCASIFLVCEKGNP